VLNFNADFDTYFRSDKRHEFELSYEFMTDHEGQNCLQTDCIIYQTFHERFLFLYDVQTKTVLSNYGKIY